jgi:hypothetical protein
LNKMKGQAYLKKLTMTTIKIRTWEEFVKRDLKD